MSRVLMAAVATLSGVGPLTPARGDVVAYWNFNSFTANTTGGQLGVLNSVAPAQGTGTLTIGGTPTVTYNTNTSGAPNGTVGSFVGSTVNGLSGEIAGGALAIIGNTGAAGAVSTNGGWVQFAISMTGLEGLSVSFATRRSGTGFDSNQLSWSTDGVSFTDFGSTWAPPDGNPFAAVSRDLSSLTVLNNAASVFVRFTFNGATSGGGNNRIDNVQFNASPLVIPLPPAAWAGLSTMAGVVGFVAIRRRRHLA